MRLGCAWADQSRCRQKRLSRCDTANLPEAVPRATRINVSCMSTSRHGVQEFEFNEPPTCYRQWLQVLCLIFHEPQESQRPFTISVSIPNARTAQERQVHDRHSREFEVGGAKEWSDNLAVQVRRSSTSMIPAAFAPCHNRKPSQTGCQDFPWRGLLGYRYMNLQHLPVRLLFVRSNEIKNRGHFPKVK